MSIARIEPFKCAKCKGYLSVFPIFKSKSGNYCNRKNCAKPYDAQIDTYLQDIVKHFRFPCYYEDKGCEEVLYVEEAKEHEENCSFGKSMSYCLVDSSCKWKGFFSEYLTEHFPQVHKNLILNRNKVQLELTENFTKCYLFNITYGTFLIKIEFTKNTSILSCEFLTTSGNIKALHCYLIVNSYYDKYPAILPAGHTLKIHHKDVVATIQLRPIKEFAKQYLDCFYCLEPVKKCDSNMCLKGHIFCDRCRVAIHAVKCENNKNSKNFKDVNEMVVVNPESLKLLNEAIDENP